MSTPKLKQTCRWKHHGSTISQGAADSKTLRLWLNNEPMFFKERNLWYVFFCSFTFYVFDICVFVSLFTFSSGGWSLSHELQGHLVSLSCHTVGASIFLVSNLNGTPFGASGLIWAQFCVPQLASKLSLIQRRESIANWKTWTSFHQWCVVPQSRIAGTSCEP